MGLWRTENGMDGNAYGRCSVCFCRKRVGWHCPCPLGFFVFVYVPELVSCFGKLHSMACLINHTFINCFVFRCSADPTHRRIA
jgi:hypothetical protein